MHLLKPLFGRRGRNLVFDPFGSYTYRHIFLGDDVAISRGATFSATESTIEIGSKVMFGPNVTIMTGDHNTSVIGSYMIDIKEKRSQDDLPVFIEDDTWIGTGAIILKGVRVGRGSIVAAGALVNRDVEPYTIVGGVPARKIGTRWSLADALRHEAALYPPDRRLSIDLLARAFLCDKPSLTPKSTRGDGLD
jgi:acetyltransferase-like isoleucine patch superfamily enzyme